MDRPDGLSAPGRAEVWPERFLFFGAAVYALMFLWRGAVLVSYPFDVDNSEAFLVHQGARLASGEFLYPPIEEFPYLVDNYPPVYPLLEAAGFVFTGPNFHWPRAVSLLSTLFTGALLAWWAFMIARSRAAAWLAALAFLSFYHVYDWSALARVDSAGVLFSILGLVVWLRGGGIAAAAMWFSLALFTKQSLFAAPLALLCLLWNEDRRAAGRLLGAMAGFGLAGWAAMLALSEGRAYLHLVAYNQNEYRFRDLWYYTRHWTTLYTVWGAAPLWILWRAWKDPAAVPNAPENRAVRLLAWYALFSLGEAALCGKIGSAPNYLLSPVCAAAVSLGVLYQYVKQSAAAAGRGLLAFFLIANAFQIVCAFHLPLPGRMPWNHPLDWSYTPSAADRQAGRVAALQMGNIEGPILSDRAGVPLVSGHPPVFQPFIFTQLTQQGLWDESRILDRIARREFPLILLQFDVSQPNWDRERFTPGFIEAVRNHYRLTRALGNNHLYAPKG